MGSRKSKMDPFGARSRVTNPALSSQHPLSHDVYNGIFDLIFFESKEFAYWSQGSQTWQLHCYGAPGCGKTTLAAIAVQRLKQKAQEIKSAPIASIFIERDIPTSSVVFVEDLLDCIYHQLPDPGFDSDHHYEQYEVACQGGESTSKRITLLRKALHSRLKPSNYTLLVVDGYDRMSEGMQVLFDREFADLQAHRLRVMLTRRVPAFEVPVWVRCDGHECEENRLKLYWMCKKCYKNQLDCYTLCYRCKEQGLGCPEDGVAYLEEMYDHVDIDVSRLDDLESYIAWDLENHSKNLGQEPIFESSDKPLNSPGTVEIDATERMQKIIQSISSKAEGNITIAKLYLDDIHRLQSLDSVETVRDRLPRNIIALFDAGIERIKLLPRVQSDIALMAIGAAAEKERGIPLATLENWMRDAITRLPHLAEAPPRSLEEVLRSANGFIAETFSRERLVATYNQLFKFYVRENYNDSLFWARSQLNRDRLSRTLTRLESDESKLTSPPLVASPPSMSNSMDTVSDTTLGSSGRSTRDFFNYSFASGGFPFPVKQTDSPRQISQMNDITSGNTKFNTPGRSFTMLPSALRRSDFRTDTVGITKELTKHGRRSLHTTHMLSGSSSKICTFCETVILSSGERAGNHQRSCTDWEMPETKECILCSTLYKDYTRLSNGHKQRSMDGEIIGYCWTIRSTAQNRDSQGSVAITFQRVLPVKVSTPKRAPNLIHMFYLFPEGDRFQVPTAEKLGLTTDPTINGGHQIRKWIHNCDHNHAHCIKPNKTTWVPTRLLDLQTGDASLIRLIETKETPIQGPYVTLSHCWGPRSKENTFLTSQRVTETEYKTDGIKLTDLSKNFQQAISVARFIGVRYIWIDSLCIIQGPGGDFDTEGHLMHKVYRNSYCNLAAADSVDSRGGLFRERTPEDILLGRYKNDGNSAIFGTQAWMVVPERLWDADLLGTSIYTRGWVFQERMLSPRILHFTHKQLFWDCGTLSACESLPNGLPLQIDDSASIDRHWRGRLQESSSLAHAPLSGPNDDSLEKFWSSSVLRYTKCNLTGQSDKTVAIWSIAKLVRDAWGDEYGSGMWGRALEEQLGWRVVDVAESKRIVELQWQQPSWSWASVQGAIFAGERVALIRCYRVKGHDGKAIQFRSKSLRRPAAEREHSDSLKEDLKMGMLEWKKKMSIRNQISPRLPENAEEQKKDNAGQKEENEKTHTASKIDPRDLEPKLASKSIDMHAPIIPGSLHFDTASKSYVLEFQTCTGLTKWEAFPDEILSNIESSYSTHFIMLASTAHITSASPFGLGLYLNDTDSDNELEIPEVPTQTTYSGIGILLIQSEEYLLRGAFHTQLPELEQKIKTFLVKNPMILPESEEEAILRGLEWELKSLREHLKELVKQLKCYHGTEEEGKHYRRTGFLRFRDLSKEAYEEIMRQELTKFWLD